MSTAAAFVLDVYHFFRPPWTEADREQIREWLLLHGVDPCTVREFTLGEGRIIVKHIDRDLSWSTRKPVEYIREYPVRTVPPVWHPVDSWSADSCCSLHQAFASPASLPLKDTPK